MKNNWAEWFEQHDYFDLHDIVLRAFFIALAMCHMLALIVLCYSLWAHFLFVPFSKYKDVIFYFGTFLNQLSTKEFLIYVLLSILSYLSIFGSITLLAVLFYRVSKIEEILQRKLSE
jgi:hypothetical protein